MMGFGRIHVQQNSTHVSLHGMNVFWKETEGMEFRNNNSGRVVVVVVLLLDYLFVSKSVFLFNPLSSLVHPHSLQSTILFSPNVCLFQSLFFLFSSSSLSLVHDPLHSVIFLFRPSTPKFAVLSLSFSFQSILTLFSVHPPGPFRPSPSLYCILQQDTVTHCHLPRVGSC